MSSQPIDYGSLFAQPGFATATQYTDPFFGSGIDYSQGNPAYAMKQNRAYFGNWGQGMGQELQSQQNTVAQDQAMYQEAMDYQAAQLGNTPGYTPGEQANIINPQAWQSGMTGPAGFASLAPTASETSGMTGTPQDYGAYFAPVAQAIPANVGRAGSQISGAVQDATQQMGSTLTGEGNTLSDIYSRASLSPSAGYYDAMAGAVSDTKAGVTAALDPNKLALNLRPNYQMSDQEVQQLEGQAAEAVASSNQTRLNEIQQRMAASGTYDPAAFAAMSKESQGMTAEEQAGAVTQAQLAAEDAQRQTWMNYAQSNLAANQTAAGMETQAAFGEGQMAADVAQRATDTQLQAGQWGAGQQAAAAETMAGQGVGAAEWTGGQGVNAAESLAGLYQSGLEYTGTQGTAVQQAMDQAQAQRAAELYGIRQGNTEYGQTQGFQQNYMTQGQLAQLYAQAAQARIQGQQQFLNWSTGQTDVNQQAGLGLNTQQISAANTAFNPMNTATGQWGTYDLGARGTSFGAQFRGAFGSALGSTLGAPARLGGGGGGTAWGG